MNRLGIYSLALLVLIVDQWSKAWVIRTFQVNESRDILPTYFALTFVRNTGGAFSVFQNSPLPLAGAALVAIGAILYYTIRARMPLSRLMAVALALPLGGAVGNLIDRVRLGFVIDFLDAHVGPHHFPVFNAADSAICVGVTLLALHFWTAPTEEKP